MKSFRSSLIYFWFFFFLFHSLFIYHTCQSTNEQSTSRVVVSLTTSPYRIEAMKPTIDCLLHKQSQAPDIIQINLPRVFGRTQIPYPNNTELPIWLVNNPKIRINRIERDYGPLTKLYPTLDTETNPNTIIIIVDDDTTYSKYMIEYMSTLSIQAQGNFSVTAHCGDWYFLKYQHFANLRVSHENMSSTVYQRLQQRHQYLPEFARTQPCCCQVVEAFASAAYHRSLFNLTPFIHKMNRTITFTEYIDIVLQNKNCFISDDWIISNFLILNEIFAIDVTNIIKYMQLSTGFGKESKGEGLHALKANGKYRYKICWRYLEHLGLSAFKHRHGDNTDDQIS